MGRRFRHRQTRQTSDDFEAPGAINWPTLFFFWGKVILTVIAYCALLYRIGEQLFSLQRSVGLIGGGQRRPALRESRGLARAEIEPIRPGRSSSDIAGS
jgi:hypothetical protein